MRFLVCMRIITRRENMSSLMRMVSLEQVAIVSPARKVGGPNSPMSTSLCAQQRGEQSLFPEHTGNRWGMSCTNAARGLKELYG